MAEIVTRSQGVVSGIARAVPVERSVGVRLDFTLAGSERHAFSEPLGTNIVVKRVLICVHGPSAVGSPSAIIMPKVGSGEGSAMADVRDAWEDAIELRAERAAILFDVMLDSPPAEFTMHRPYSGELWRVGAYGRMVAPAALSVYVIFTVEIL